MLLPLNYINVTERHGGKQILFKCFAATNLCNGPAIRETGPKGHQLLGGVC